MTHYFTSNENLKSELRTIKYVKNNISFCFYSDIGIFSKDKIDYGSSFLIDTFLKNLPEKHQKILDVGCGYGFLGIVLAKILNIDVTMVDVNKRGIHLTNMNVLENNIKSTVLESNIYEKIEQKYDVIITNPPIKAGKVVIKKILINARNFLEDDGELWFVIRKNQGALSIYKILLDYYKIRIVDKSKGFYIFKAKNIDN